MINIDVWNCSIESQCLILYANEYKIEYRFFSNPLDVPNGWVAYGSVDWVEKALRIKIAPNYYPDFLAHWIKRNIWCQDNWSVDSKIFIKPADINKRFTGFVTSGTWRGKKKGPFWCSDIVIFTNEWRYYVSNGKVVSAKWYAGTNKNIPAPELDIEWPETFCGSYWRNCIS